MLTKITGAALLCCLGLWALAGDVAQQAAPADDPAPEKPIRRPILPIRPLRETAPEVLHQPVARWDAKARQWVTTGWQGFWGAAAVGGTISPDGAEEIHVDLPRELHLKNRGGSDGAGLCVFASLKHSSMWQHVWQTQMVFEYMFTRPGGGYPSKVDKVIKAICQEKGQPVPKYVQVESRDIEVLKLACRTGRMPGITYNFSPTGRYGGRKIAHMVSLVHASDKWFGILDNNYPGSIEWMDPGTFLRVYAGTSGNGWSVIFLNEGPPPPPRNAAA